MIWEHLCSWVNLYDDLKTSTLYVVGANEEIDTKNEEELYVYLCGLFVLKLNVKC